ncbi:MAG: SDR family NAD(P)-dependent oxidoreductase, partial [Desulfobacteraceae bacterium]|nr:SDR family NAD(P)-dependent oxidoreductase [Desulfobacteraceae bacterium]
HYRPVWEKRAVGPKRQDAGLHGGILLFDSDVLRTRAIREKAAGPVIQVAAGDRFRQTDEDRFEIDPTRSGDYRHLMQSLVRENRMPGTLLYLWPMEADPKPAQRLRSGDLDDPLVDHFSDLGLHAAFHLIQAVSLEGNPRPERILFFHPSRPQGANPFYDAVSALAKPLRLVLPKLAWATVEMTEIDDSRQISRIVLREAAAREAGPFSEVRYVGADRFTKRYQRFVPEVSDTEPLKRQGVYMVTGGLGGLGLVIAKLLASEYDARLVLTGRSPLDAETSARWKTLGPGPDLLYIAADAADERAMAGVVEQARQRFGRIDGIFHTAGVVSENVVIGKSFDEFAATLRPKVRGTVVLDRVTRDLSLDFLMLFSSTSSLLGDFGQCDYAAANRFLDGFGRLRESLRMQGKRSGRTLSVNWPLWREGGMNVDEAAESFYLGTSGMDYLETHTGWTELIRLLKSDGCHTALFVGDPERIHGFLNPSPAAAAPDAKPIAGLKPGRAPGDSVADIRQQLESDLLRIASAILKVDAGRMDPVASLADYGFDSVSLKILADTLNQTYGIDLIPAVFFSHTSIRRLAGHLLETFQRQVRGVYDRAFGQGESSASPPVESASARLSSRPVPGGKPAGTEKPEEREPIAVIGIHGMFPGSADLAEFWKHLESEADLITEVPPDRWHWPEVLEGLPDGENKRHLRYGGFIADVDKFDPLFFRISPKEAAMMDPQHRLFLQTVWKTVEDAGCRASALSGKSVAVLVGMEFNDYLHMLLTRSRGNALTGTGTADTMLANRVSFFMNWHGPSEVIDTACSGSLVAVHRAVRMLRSGECDMAVAGGVSLTLSPNSMIGADALGILSPDGRCKTFDKGANGYVKGEGVGAVLLKPLSRALSDNDPIYAVIRGSAVNHGGTASSLTAPNPEAQAALLVAAYEDAAVAPETVTFLELHGTGTELGDPTEVEGIKKAFQELARRRGRPIQASRFCGLGSVKTNIGHLEPAAGIAGLIKVILAMRHGKLPGTPHFKTLNPFIRIADSPFYVVDRTRDWEPLAGEDKKERIPRRAGVSSFGFGGANAHVVLEEYPGPGPAVGLPTLSARRPSDPSRQQGGPQLIVLSAKTRERLIAYAGALSVFIRASEGLSEAHKGKRRPDPAPIREKLLSWTGDLHDVAADDLDPGETLASMGLDPVGLAALAEKVNE